MSKNGDDTRYNYAGVCIIIGDEYTALRRSLVLVHAVLDCATEK
jgi:hypothetical protein